MRDLGVDGAAVRPHPTVERVLRNVCARRPQLDLRINDLGADAKRALNEANAKRAAPARLEL